MITILIAQRCLYFFILKHAQKLLCFLFISFKNKPFYIVYFIVKLGGNIWKSVQAKAKFARGQNPIYWKNSMLLEDCLIHKRYRNVFDI